MPRALRGLPGRGHHQHDHVVQERTGFLRAHTQVQTGPDVSRRSVGAVVVLHCVAFSLVSAVCCVLRFQC